MKRVLSLIAALLIGTALLLQGCSGEMDRKAELRGSLKSTKSSIKETFKEDTCEFSLVSEYLQSWAESSEVSGINVKKVSDTYVVLENPATDDAKKAESTVLQCSVNTTDCENSLDILATSLACLLGPESHGDLRLIVTEYTYGQRIGAQDVPSSYLKGDNFIGMQYSKEPSVYTSGPDSATCLIRSKASREEPEYDSAYKITMEIDKYTDPSSFDKANNYPNPINAVGSLLANYKSSGKLFEIASFSSKAIDGYGPYEASATIVMNSSNEEGFMKKFDKSYENAEDKIKKTESEFTYKVEPVDMPDSVLGEEAANNLISLMYTLNTGICYQDEDSGLIHSASYLQDIKTDTSISVTVVARARGSENLSTICKEYEVTSGLCDMKFTCGKAHKVWGSSDNSKLASWFSQRVPVDSDDSVITIKEYDNDILSKKRPGTNMISYTFDSSESKQVLVNIVDFTDANSDK